MGESLEQVTARVMSTAFFLKDDAPKKGRRKGRHRLTKLAEGLGSAQLDQLLGLLGGTLLYTTINGEPYAVRKDVGGWFVGGLAPGSVERFVLKDFSGCTCPHQKYRGGECKHMEALRRLL